jgi:hypothetical protein
LGTITLALAATLFAVALRKVTKAESPDSLGNEQAATPAKPGKPKNYQVGIAALLILLAVVGAIWGPSQRKTNQAVDVRPSGTAPAGTAPAATAAALSTPQPTATPSVTVNTQGGQGNTQVGNNNKQTIINNLPAVADSVLTGVLTPDHKSPKTIFDKFLQRLAATIEAQRATPAELLNEESPESPRAESQKFTARIRNSVPPDALQLYLRDTNLGYTTKRSQVVLKVRDKELLRVYRDQSDKISLYAALLSKDGAIVDSEENKFHVYTKDETFLRYEKTRHSLIVYDKQVDEVLNIYYLNRVMIRVLGRFRYDNGLAFVVSRDNMMLAGSKPITGMVNGDNEGSLFHIQ